MKLSIIAKAVLFLFTVGGFLAIQFDNGTVVLPAAPLPVILPSPVISSVIPDRVDIGAVSGPETARPFFDYFSWRSFVALNWPAAIGADGKPLRGVPDTSTGANIGKGGRRVWESYKTDWELFRPKGVKPTEWESYTLPDGTSTNPCGNNTDSKMLVMVTKMDSIVDGLNQAFTGPLIDQNRNYVRYEIHVNRPFYETTKDNGWYIIDPKNKTKVLPDGVIEIKTAWRELTEKDDPKRFYTVNAMIVEPGPKPECRPAQMGMVGFHIANKVAGFREWVWSTFEHVDNLPEGDTDSGLHFSFNNGMPSPTPMPGESYNRKARRLADMTKPLPAAADPLREPIQVFRHTPISPAGQAQPTTVEINTEWQNALSGTVWRFYKLVITQWPTIMNGESFNPKGQYPVASDDPFPTDEVANITMETYFQVNRNFNSCMRCHFSAAGDDFSFLFSQRGFTPQPPLPAALNATEKIQRIDADRIKKSVTLSNLSRILKDQ